MLVENLLVAVISLPAGVFNPYSGVKTSILILDKSLAKKTDKIAFFKVENDGFGLGAQRREVSGGQLSQVQVELAEYLQAVRNQVSTDDFLFPLGLIVPKVKIAANGEYNLSGERYRDAIITNHSFLLVQLEDVFKLSSGRGLTQSNMKEGVYPVYGGNGKVGTHSDYFLEEPNIIIGRVGAYCGAVHITEPKSWITDNALYITEYKQEIDQHYLAKALTQLNLNRFAKVGGQPSISQTTVYECKIPLPSIAIQKEIVTEIEGYQKVINGARAVIDNYRLHIAISPDWEMVELGKICTLGATITPNVNIDASLPYFGADSIESNTGKLLKIGTAESQRVSGLVYEFSGERLLYSKIRPYLNKLSVVNMRGY